MPRHSEQIVIDHTAENLFDLVKDIRRYPEFIRWIDSMQVTNEDTSETFSTQVSAFENESKIVVSLKDGPFRRLSNRWQFEAIDKKQTRIHFHIDYEFKNFVLGLLARANTKLAIDRIMFAFKTEADRRYSNTT